MAIHRRRITLRDHRVRGAKVRAVIAHEARALSIDREPLQ